MAGRGRKGKGKGVSHRRVQNGCLVAPWRWMPQLGPQFGRRDAFGGRVCLGGEQRVGVGACAVDGPYSEPHHGGALQGKEECSRELGTVRKPDTWVRESRGGWMPWWQTEGPSEGGTSGRGL